MAKVNKEKEILVERYEKEADTKEKEWTEENKKNKL